MNNPGLEASSDLPEAGVQGGRASEGSARAALGLVLDGGDSALVDPAEAVGNVGLGLQEGDEGFVGRVLLLQALVELGKSWSRKVTTVQSFSSLASGGGASCRAIALSLGRPGSNPVMDLGFF